jgi:hypothetical protein
MIRIKIREAVQALYRMTRGRTITQADIDFVSKERGLAPFQKILLQKLCLGKAEGKLDDK